MKIALCGNPNSGKTTLFNLLTGATARVGNWPGVTVEKKEGIYKKKNITIVDLPGIYSLSPYTPEEVISRNYILDEKPDAIINIVDVTNLERSLYLTSQLLETDIPVVIALNMLDEIQKSGAKIDSDELSKRFDVPAIQISALKGLGVEELMSRVEDFKPRKPLNIFKQTPFEDIFSQIINQYQKKNLQNPVFKASKIFECDQMEMQAQPEIAQIADELKKQTDTGEFEGDFEALCADARYKFIEKILKGVYTKGAVSQAVKRSDKIDKLLTHKFLGIPIFLFLMFTVFHLTFSENLLFLGWLIPDSFDNVILGSGAINSPGIILFNCMEFLTNTISDNTAAGLININAPLWLNGFIINALMGGIFAVLSFLPQILLLFFFLSILEDSGYMARVAFIMDRVFKKFGLSGKAFLPLLSCFGCAVPGIMATRTLESERERRLTVMLTPFFSCGAKMPIWATFAGIMFMGAYADLIVFSMYGLGILTAIIAAIILKLASSKIKSAPFIMELPIYRLPKPSNVSKRLWAQLKEFVIRAGTVIAISVVILWFLSSFNATGYTLDASESILGYIGKGISVFFVPLGFGQGNNGWMFVVAAFTGLVAKEMVISSLGVFSGMSIDPLEIDGAVGATPVGELIGSLSPGAAFAFMAFNLLSVPCMAAVAAAIGELKGGKSIFRVIGFWLLTAYIAGLVLYLSISYWWTTLIFAALLVILILLLILKDKGKINFNGKFKRKNKPKNNKCGGCNGCHGCGG